MSESNIPGRAQRMLVKFAAIAALLALVHLTMSWAGFSHWIRETPAAMTGYRLIAILLFGGLGVFSLLTPRRFFEPRPILYRLAGILFVGMAAVHIAMLITGTPVPSNLFFPE